MSRTRLFVVCLGLLPPTGIVACDAEEGPLDTSNPTGAAESTGAATSTGATTSMGAAESSSGGDGPGTSSSSGSTEPPSAEEFEAMCNAITDEAECEAMVNNDFFDELAVGYACNWETWVSVAVVDGVCSFGEVQAGCTFESYSTDGCVSWGACGGDDGVYAGIRDGEDGTLEIGTSPQGWCTGPYQGGCGDALDEPPECACACDETWPGA